MEIKNLLYKIIFIILAILLIIFIKPYSSFAYVGDISKAKVTLGTTSWEYIGKGIQPSVTVKINGEKLEKNKDYTVSYSNNVNVGTAKITIKAKGLLRRGSVTKTFKITKTDVSDCIITYNKTRNYYNNGEQVKPSVKIEKGINKIKENNYTVTYKNNTKVGIGQIIIKGKGNLKGTITKTFKIIPTSLKNTDIYINDEEFEFAYTSKAIKPGLTIKYNGKILKKGTDYTVAYSNNINVGTAKVIITGKGNFKDTITKTFKIKPRDMEYARIENMDAYMLGLDSSLKISYNGKILKKNVDYTITEKKTYKLENKFSDDHKHLNWRIDFVIKGINNYCDIYPLVGDIGFVNFIVSHGMLDNEKRNQYNYDYINKKLNNELDNYIININKAVIMENNYYIDHKGIPVLGHRYNNNESTITLHPGEDFEYKKQGNKWIITGINSFYGTREIKIKK